MMRSNHRGFCGSAVHLLPVALAALLTMSLAGQASAQGAPQAAPSEAQGEVAPKQLALSQATIDHLIAAQKQIRAIEAKMPENDQGAPDPKIEGKIEDVVKKSGFASMADFADASYSVGVVLAGVDPSTGSYIGAQASLEKQITEVQADKKMPPQEKQEALNELKAAAKAATSEKPLPGNVDLVKANSAKLNEGMQQAD